MMHCEFSQINLRFCSRKVKAESIRPKISASRSSSSSVRDVIDVKGVKESSNLSGELC